MGTGLQGAGGARLRVQRVGFGDGHSTAGDWGAWFRVQDRGVWGNELQGSRARAVQGSGLRRLERRGDVVREQSRKHET